ncbi:uncharacterized protein LOC132278098 [Cornus florida]|uniref:uncharacterized protein LOC132278098 n=1 Tax=Cornus florida TaxID=4283 RepID=UPI00289E8248|nr:uncharacterized protein LOC132278098 [Cornus florida]
METYAHMGCVLKVNAGCEACKIKVMEVLGSVCGTAKVTGEVEPNVLLRALAASGKHAELVWVKIKSQPPQLPLPPAGQYGGYDPYGYNRSIIDQPPYGIGCRSSIEQPYGPYGYNRSLIDQLPYQYNQYRRAMPERHAYWGGGTAGTNQHYQHYPLRRPSTQMPPYPYHGLSPQMPPYPYHGTYYN